MLRDKTLLSLLLLSTHKKTLDYDLLFLFLATNGCELRGVFITKQTGVCGGQ